MESKVKSILTEVLPAGFNIIVVKRKNCFYDEYLKIAFSPNEFLINNVSGQYPQVVSLRLELDTMVLETQVFGGCGGGRINLKPDMNHEKEKYLYCVGFKIPFRKPKQDEASVLKAIERFASNYLKALKDNKERLMYHEYIDYSFLDSVK